MLVFPKPHLSPVYQAHQLVDDLKIEVWEDQPRDLRIATKSLRLEQGPKNWACRTQDQAVCQKSFTSARED